jgi:hypothetical protein
MKTFNSLSLVTYEKNNAKSFLHKILIKYILYDNYLL